MHSKSSMNPFRIIAAWRWAWDAFWPVLLVVAAVIAIPLGFALMQNDARRRERTPERQAIADAWLRRNGVAGVATCFGWTSVCDVVPSDPRPPFKIECYFADDNDAALCRVSP